MKVVIIGGGIAGLTMGVFLRKQNIEVVVNERAIGMPIQGQAFLMHSDGILTLKELAAGTNIQLESNFIDTYSLNRPDGEEIMHLHLKSWQLVKRSSLIRFLYSLFPVAQIKEGRDFSHFIYEGEKIVAASFVNGEVEYGDIFIGADGGNSKVREALFGKTNFTPVKVKEIIGLSNNVNIAKTHSRVFSKFQNKNSGLAFGFIPTSDSEFVWFMQYDPNAGDLNKNTPEEMKKFCFSRLKDFPPVVKDILESNDFTKSYTWNTRDFNPLPVFHKQNAAIIGDAAHLSLPFTSAGTTNAIVDAKTLVDCLVNSIDHEQAFENFYKIRSEEVTKHIYLGRELQNIFLNPKENDDELKIPLITPKKTIGSVANGKLIQVLYFTDPICSTCWIIQPLLRKLKLEYDKYLDIEYCMGGLLPTWDHLSKEKISNPADAAKHWEEVCHFHEMPLDGDVWIEDPLHSSYPPSIAFKAAQLQDPELALLFLRRIKEMVFLEKKNIIKWDFLKKAAFESGLDCARLLRDCEGRAQDLFKEDLIKAAELGVTSFPTIFFSDQNDNSFMIQGYQPYEKFEEIIHKLNPSIIKEKINTSPENLFTEFPTMVDKEFAFLSDIPIKIASKVLHELFDNGSIDKYESKNGIIWKSKFSTGF